MAGLRRQVQRQPSRRGWWLALELLLGAMLLGAAALAGYLFVHRPWENRLDVAGFAALPADPGSRRWHLLADLGTVPVLVGGVLVAALLNAWRDRARALASLVGPLVAVFVTERVAKPLVGRHVTPFGGFSYPSGTVTAATALVAVLVLALPMLARPPAALVGAGLVAAVSCAVIAMRWHFPTDALGGALVGLGAVLFVDGLAHVPGWTLARSRAERRRYEPLSARERLESLRV